MVTDSVFSADGVLAPLRALHDVCRRHGALLIVDEAHGLGVRGGGGRGLLHEVGLAGAPDVVMTTTLSKALGSQGGVVLGPAAVRAHLIDAARPFIFDTGLAPAAVGAALAALRVLIDEPWRAQAVLDHASALAEICGVAERPDSAVVSVILGEPEVALAAAVGVPGSRRAGRLLPSADGPGRYVAAAADGAGVIVRRRNGFGPRGTHRSARRDARERSRRHGHRHRRRQDGGHCGACLLRAAGRHRRRSVQTRADRQPARRRPRRCGAAVRGQRPAWHMALSRTAGTRRGRRARRHGAADARRAGGVGRIGRRGADPGRGCGWAAGRNGCRRGDAARPRARPGRAGAWSSFRRDWAR